MTAYATRVDLVDRYGASEIDRLAPVEMGVEGREVSALADASAEIDSVLARRYALPLPVGHWLTLRWIACDIARGRLYDDAAPDAVVTSVREARRQLRELGSGERLLIDAGRVPPLARASAGARASGTAPALTREALRDA